MTLFVRVYPGRHEYRLPEGEEAGAVTKALAEVVGSSGCLVLGYEAPDHGHGNAVVVISGNVECVELVDVPEATSPG